MNYYGHQGPIYRVRCNPFWHSQDCPIFISSSYDWTVKVWHAREEVEKLSCHQISGDRPLTSQVNDVNWSPSTSSCFALVTNDGRIEIWDLFINNLAPVVTHFDKLEDGVTEDSTPKTIVRFSASSPVILSGNEKGGVDVYRSKGLEHVQVSDQDQINRLLGAIKKDDFASDDKDAKKDEDGA